MSVKATTAATMIAAWPQLRPLGSPATGTRRAGLELPASTAFIAEAPEASASGVAMATALVSQVLIFRRWRFISSSPLLDVPDRWVLPTGRTGQHTSCACVRA